MKKTLVKILTVAFCMAVIACTFVVPSFAYCDDCEEYEAIGYQNGLTAGNKEGYENGHEVGYAEGYAAGEKNANEGVSMLDSLREFVYAIFDAPATLINSMLDFDFMGLNVAGFVRTILTLVVVGVIVFLLVKIIL